jgi:DNA-binding transcriptional MerR regulator
VVEVREWLNIKELAERTNIADTTIRRYIDKFSDFFNYKGGVRSRRYDDSAIKVLVRIKQLFDDGYETNEADSILRKEFAVVIDDGRSEKEVNTPALVPAEEFEEMKKEINELKELNKLLVERLEKQEEERKKREDHRDFQLVEIMRFIQEEKQLRIEAAATEDKASFWSKLFGKK